MGFFDFLDTPKTGLLADPDAGLMIASGLLSARKGEGLAGLSQGVSQAVAAHRLNQANERANRANDLQQLTGTYSMLKQQEFQRMLAAKNAGQPYVPNPMLQQIEQKMAGLVGAPALANMQTPNAAPQGAPQVAQAPAQMPSGPQMSTPQNPQLAVPPPQQPQQQQQPPMSPQNMPGFGGPAGGQPVEAWLATDPSGKAYMEQLAKEYMEGQKPVINRGFGVGRMVNGQYIPDKASLDQALSMKKGELDLTEPFKTLTTTDASGAQRPQFLYQLPGYPGAMPGGAAPASPSAPTLSDRVAKLTVTQPSQNQDPWATMPKRVIPQGMGQSTFNAEMDRKQAETAAELTKKYGAVADVNNARIATNNQALDLVDKADTGWLASNIAAFRPVLAAAGFPEQGYKAATDQALTKDLTNTALARGKQLFGSRFTQSEVGIMLTQANPGPNMQKIAMKFLLQTDNAAAKYGIQQSADLGKYLQQGGDPQRFDGWYSQTFPATKATSGIKMEGGKLDQPLLMNQTAIYKAKQAIAQGKDPALVKQRLIDSGFDPSGL